MLLPLFAELQRRRVFRAAAGYGLAAFAVLQIIEPVMHGFHWPEFVLSYVVVAVALGFPLVVGLAWVYDLNAGRLERSETSASTLRGARLAATLGAIAVLAATPVTAWWLLRSSPVSPSSVDQALRARLDAVPPASEIRPIPSLAVLPLANLSDDPEQEYFADGLAEELLNLLAKVPGVRVAARTSAFAFRGKNVKVTEIGRELGVAVVLEGSVRRSGDRIRVAIQLVDTSAGYRIWSDSYDRTLTDVFAIQDEIANAVVAALRIKLLPGQAPSTRERRTTNPEVYDQYLLGRHLFNRSDLEGWRRSVQAYEKALALDPGYAPAWAALSFSMFWLADEAESREAFAEGMKRAEEAANKAVELGRDLPDGYAARILLRTATSRDWAGARADVDRALALGPEDAGILFSYGLLLTALGRVEEAIVVYRKATLLDPLNPDPWAWLGVALMNSGRLNEARQALNRSLEISPAQLIAPMSLGLTYLLDGQPEAARTAFERSSREVVRKFGVALVAHELGHAEQAQRALDELIAGFAPIGAFQIAVVYAWRGQKDQAFEWLDRAYQQRDGGLVLFRSEPTLRKLRADARYAAFLRRMNLPPD